MAEKKKPGCFGKMIRFVCFFFVFAAIFGAMGNSDKETKNPTPPQTEKATQAPTNTPTNEPINEPTQKPTFDPEAAKTILGAMLANSYSYYDISGDETGFIINVSGEGIGQALRLTKQSQNTDLLKTWEETKQTFVCVYDSVQNFLKISGMEKPVLMMNIVNDQNHDDVVLSVYEGQVIYDAITAQ